MGTIYKCLIGVVAGVALVGGGAHVYAGPGDATIWEPCKMTPPATGVTQLCQLGSQGVSNQAPATAVQENSGGGVGDGVVIITNIPAPIPAPPEGGSQVPASNTTLPGVDVPAIQIPGGSLLLVSPGRPDLPALPDTNLSSLPAIQVTGTGTTDAGTQSASAVLGDPNSTSGLSIDANMITSSAGLAPFSSGGADESATTLNVSAAQKGANSGGLNATASVSTSAATSSSPSTTVTAGASNGNTPIIRVDATATSPSTASETSAGVDVTAGAGGGPAVSVSVSGDAGTGGSAATGASASAGDVSVSVGASASTSGGDVTAAVSSGGSSVASAGAGKGGVSVSIGDVNIGIGSGGVSSGSGSGGSGVVAGLIH